MKRIVIAGGSGYLGQLLTRHFRDRGDRVTILTRGKDRLNGEVRFVHWDGRTTGEWAAVLEGADLLINLSGRSVNCRYADKNKRAIMDSRILPTRALHEAIEQSKEPPPVWLNASSIAFYGPTDKETSEDSTAGQGFSADVCRTWERELFKESTRPVRKVALRIGLVLGRRDGVLKPFRIVAGLGLGGTMGSGKQFLSWIHEQDTLGLIDHIIASSRIEGPVNVTAPMPVTNRQFMKHLRRSLGMPVGLPAYSWMVRIGTFLLGTEHELVLRSMRAVPQRALESGFSYCHPVLPEALKDIFS